MMKRGILILSLILCHLWPSRAQIQMLFTADSLSYITSPADLDSIFYWFAADVAVYDSAGTSISSGEGVGTWTDLSGNGYDVVQADTTKDPRWCATCGPAGKPAIVFNGVDEFLASTAHWWGSDDLSVFLIGKHSDGTYTTSETYIARIDIAGGQRQFDFKAQQTGGQIQIFADKDGGGTNYVIDSDGAGSTSFRLLCQIWATTSSVIYINGSAQATTRAVTGSGDGTILNATNQFSIGCRNPEGIPNSYLGGSISEIIVTTNAVSATTRAAIENYLNRKYDLY